MNVRLTDGTVRCAEHFDSSSYQSETSDPCLYCEADAETDTSDQEWLNALSALIVDQPERFVQFNKIQCSWCHEPATWKILDGYYDKPAIACTDHGAEWYPDLFPQVSTA